MGLYECNSVLINLENSQLLFPNSMLGIFHLLPWGGGENRVDLKNIEGIGKKISAHDIRASQNLHFFPDQCPFLTN